MIRRTGLAVLAWLVPLLFCAQAIAEPRGLPTRIFGASGLNATFAFEYSGEHYPEELKTLRTRDRSTAERLCRTMSALGRTDWRLPDEREFKGLFASGVFPSQKYIGDGLKEHGKGLIFWSSDSTLYLSARRESYLAEYQLGETWRKHPGNSYVHEAFTLCVRGAYGGNADVKPAVVTKPPEPIRVPVLTGEKEEDRRARVAEQQKRPSAEVTSMIEAARARDRQTAKMNADRQVKVMENELQQRRSCMKPEMRNACGCLRFQARPPGGFATCSK